MFLTQISEGGILSIYDKTKLMCRTWIESVNNLFNMGKDLETEVDGLKGGIVKDVTLTEVDKHYTLTILYDDNTSDTVTWDDSTVGIEDITLNYSDGVYILAIELTDGTRYTFSIPVGDIVTQQELTALNLGTPDDTASSTGSLWARVKDAVSRIGINEGNITTLQTADSDNVKKTGTSVVTGDIQVPTPNGNSSVVNKEYVDEILPAFSISDNRKVLGIVNSGTSLDWISNNYIKLKAIPDNDINSFLDSLREMCSGCWYVGNTIGADDGTHSIYISNPYIVSVTEGKNQTTVYFKGNGQISIDGVTYLGYGSFVIHNVDYINKVFILTASYITSLSPYTYTEISKFVGASSFKSSALSAFIVDI